MEGHGRSWNFLELHTKFILESFLKSNGGHGRTWMVIESQVESSWRFMEGLKEGYGRSWKVMEGHPVVILVSYWKLLEG